MLVRFSCRRAVSATGAAQKSEGPRWRCCGTAPDDTTAMGGRISCIRAACGRSVLVEASAFGVDGRPPEPCREADGNGAGQVTGRRRVARHAERSWSGR